MLSEAPYIRMGFWVGHTFAVGLEYARRARPRTLRPSCSWRATSARPATSTPLASCCTRWSRAVVPLRGCLCHSSRMRWPCEACDLRGRNVSRPSAQRCRSWLSSAGCTSLRAGASTARPLLASDNACCFLSLHASPQQLGSGWKRSQLNLYSSCRRSCRLACYKLFQYPFLCLQFGWP